jgi:thiamine-phosphate pyrophosphorylase
MDAGEAGCDYVLFGEPRADGSLPAFPGVVERAQWWAEIFEIPCAAYCPDAEGVDALVATGCEFVALGPWALQGDDTVAFLASISARLAARQPVDG